MNFQKLHNLIVELKLPSYREKQIRKAYFCDLAGGWDDITVLPKNLREELAKNLEWSTVKENKVLKNKSDKSEKAALKLEDGEIIETVLIRHKDGRNTVCVSSQVGCPMGCTFCATGKSGFKRNLLADEIVDQVLFFAQRLKNKSPLTPLDKGGVTNIVFMGMGEPMLNYDNVMKAIRTLNDKEGFNLGVRHISISTCGIVPGIKNLATENLQVNLALSMHAPTDRKRSKFMPINEKYNLEKVMEAIDEYIRKTNRRVMIEYLLIDGVNDREDDALKLVELMAKRPLCYVNIIPYNQTDNYFRKSPKDNIKYFTDTLKGNGIKFTIRHSFGGTIDAACGQLRQSSINN